MPVVGGRLLFVGTDGNLVASRLRRRRSALAQATFSIGGTSGAPPSLMTAAGFGFPPIPEAGGAYWGAFRIIRSNLNCDTPEHVAPVVRVPTARTKSMTLESDVKAIRSAADKLIAKSDKLTKGDSDSAMAALAVALMSLAHATDTVGAGSMSYWT